MEQITKGHITRYEATSYIICKDTDKALSLIREALASGETLEVVNAYETFYGVGFDGWLREGIADIPCSIDAGYPLSWTTFPRDYLITPIRK